MCANARIAFVQGVAMSIIRIAGLFVLSFVYAQGAFAQSLCGGTTTNGTGQTYNSAVILTCDATLTDSSGGTIAFQSSVDGAYALAVSTSGATGFGGAVGGTTALSSLNASGGSLALGGSVNTTGALTLASNSGALTTNGVLSGSNVTLTGINGITLNNNTTATGTLKLVSSSNITQTAGTITVNGTSNFNAGANAITLPGLNAFTGAVSLTGGTTQITNSGSLTLGTVDVGNSLALTAPSVSNPTGITFGNGATTGNVTGDYSQSGTLNLHATPTNADHLAITGNATLGGTLSVAFSGPPGGGSGGLLAVVLSANGTITGTFSTLNVTGLAANQTAKLIYNAHTVQISVEQTQAITNFTATPPNPTYAPGGTFTVSATGGGSLYPVVFSIAAASSGICSAGGTNGSTITMLSPGLCTVLANQADDGAFAAAPQVSLDVTIARATQTITFTSTAPTNAMYNGPAYTVTATADSGLPVTLAISGASAPVCALSGSSSGSLVTFTAPGTCLIDADQAGDGTYAPAPQAHQSFAVGPGVQTLSITAPTSIELANGPATMTATASSGLPVTVTSTTPTICTVSGTAPTFSIALLAPGACTLDVTQIGFPNYASVSQNVTIAVLAPLVPTPMLDRRALLLLTALIGLFALARARRA